jgi:hypothetical protein
MRSVGAHRIEQSARRLRRRRHSAPALYEMRENAPRIGARARRRHGVSVASEMSMPMSQSDLLDLLP